MASLEAIGNVAAAIYRAENGPPACSWVEIADDEVRDRYRARARTALASVPADASPCGTCGWFRDEFREAGSCSKYVPVDAQEGGETNG